ncbi:hypothetical protein DFH06DRAFT_1305639, partial [Mycena polygramma]
MVALAIKRVYCLQKGGKSAQSSTSERGFPEDQCAGRYTPEPHPIIRLCAEFEGESHLLREVWDKKAAEHRFLTTWLLTLPRMDRSEQLPVWPEFLSPVNLELFGGLLLQQANTKADYYGNEIQATPQQSFLTVLSGFRYAEGPPTADPTSNIGKCIKHVILISSPVGHGQRQPVDCGSGSSFLFHPKTEMAPGAFGSEEASNQMSGPRRALQRPWNIACCGTLEELLIWALGPSTSTVRVESSRPQARARPSRRQAYGNWG